MAAFTSMVQHPDPQQHNPHATTSSSGNSRAGSQPDMTHLFHYLQQQTAAVASANNVKNFNSSQNSSSSLAFQHQILAAASQQIQPGFLSPFQAPRLPFNFSLGFNVPPFNLEDDGVIDNPQVELEDKHLWDMFSNCVNEMIITKSGR